MSSFTDKLKVALGGVVPLGLRDNFAALVKGQVDFIYVPYDFGSWGEKMDNFLQSPGVEFQDGNMGVKIWEGKENEI